MNTNTIFPGNIPAEIISKIYNELDKKDDKALQVLSKGQLAHLYLWDRVSSRALNFFTPRDQYVLYKEVGKDIKRLNEYCWAVVYDIPKKAMFFTCLAMQAVRFAFCFMNGQNCEHAFLITIGRMGDSLIQIEVLAAAAILSFFVLHAFTVGAFFKLNICHNPSWIFNCLGLLFVIYELYG